MLAQPLNVRLAIKAGNNNRGVVNADMILLSCVCCIVQQNNWYFETDEDIVRHGFSEHKQTRGRLC